MSRETYLVTFSSFMQKFTSETQKVGKLGEDVAERYLRNKGFEILERNYTKKWGEIDIVAKKSKKIHFVEVKTIKDNGGEVTVAPEENIHEKKLARIYRAADTYLAERNVDEKIDWQVDAVTILLDPVGKTAKVRYFECI